MAMKVSDEKSFLSGREAMPSKTFCSVPWTQIATNATGYYRVCCNASPGKNLVRDEQGKPVRVVDRAAEDIWRSPTYVQIRSQMMNGERPEMCTRCFREEDAGVKSARQSANEKWTLSHEQIQGAPFHIRYVDLRLGNLCNLRCRMCNPYASNKWVDEWNLIAQEAALSPSDQRLSQEEQARLRTIDWPENPRTWENLSQIINQVEEVYLTGGEPFLSIEHSRLLERLISSGRAGSIRLKYNTNLTSLPQRLQALWPHFGSIQFNVSIDGFGALDEFIRHPTKWETVIMNLKELISAGDHRYKADIGIHTTVQAYNILRLDELLHFLQNEFELFPYLNILNHPHCLNVRTLPPGLKQVARERLSLWSGKREISEVLDYMNQEDWSELHFQDFQSYTKRLDKSRGEDFLGLVPEFRDFFDAVRF